jgi:hypothetical protein
MLFLLLGWGESIKNRPFEVTENATQTTSTTVEKKSFKHVIA